MQRASLPVARQYRAEVQHRYTVVTALLNKEATNNNNCCAISNLAHSSSATSEGAVVVVVSRRDNRARRTPDTNTSSCVDDIAPSPTVHRLLARANMPLIDDNIVRKSASMIFRGGFCVSVFVFVCVVTITTKRGNKILYPSNSLTESHVREIIDRRRAPLKRRQRCVALRR